MAERPGEELGSELNRGMWLGSESRMGRNRRGRDKRERHGEWVSSGMESGESRFGSLEERIRGLAERIEGLERGTWKTEEKRGNTVSSSDGEEQNAKWKWDGESWWCKIEAADFEVGEGDFGARDQAVERMVSIEIGNRMVRGEGATRIWAKQADQS